MRGDRVTAGGLTVTVLGCSGTYSAAHNACSGFLVRGGGTTVVLDCGPGTLANLQEHVSLDVVDAVVVSHEHPDHWLEVPLLRHAWRYGWGTRRTGVPLFTTAGTARLADGLTDGRLDDTFDVTEVRDGSDFDVGALAVSCSRTAHSVESLAVRVEHCGTAVGYTADTGADWRIAELGDGLDLVVAEATFLATDGLTGIGSVHMTAAQAGESAAEAGAARLALTHVLPGRSWAEAVAEATAAYGAPVDATAPHRTFEVGVGSAPA
ncbi:MAG: MBL fold metallo-hydrolase [Microthrixaceae bacterium]